MLIDTVVQDTVEDYIGAYPTLAHSDPREQIEAAIIDRITDGTHPDAVRAFTQLISALPTSTDLVSQVMKVLGHRLHGSVASRAFFMAAIGEDIEAAVYRVLSGKVAAELALRLDS